ncbi:DUF397 domain-containing protein [Krasilnikovia sp. MM14-A1259]|uniref:DUF397 domain-containing protein n=1 Tax=Krasilnikovia sp. MM14-A1259 TaxID=3373539 RepID=UPI003808425E
MDLAGAKWFKSSRSSGNGACVEVAIVGDGVAVRDTKDRDSGTLAFTHQEWHAFVDGVKRGEFDL